MDVVVAVLAAALTSSAVAAVVSGMFSDRTEKRKELRNHRILLAGEFAGGAMAALAAVRDYKPTKGTYHRHGDLHTDRALRDERAARAEAATSALRPLRGRVWVLFPGRSSEEEPPTTTADWAEEVVGALRRTSEVCRDFWRECDNEGQGAQSQHRKRLEEHYNEQYKEWKEYAWLALDAFATSAADRIEASSRWTPWSMRVRSWLRLRRRRSGLASDGESADSQKFAL